MLSQFLVRPFAANTFWEFEVISAESRQTEDGKWRVKLSVRAHKVVVDTEGIESDVSLDENVEIGVFSGVEDNSKTGPLYLSMHRIVSGDQEIIVTTTEKPERVVVDPRNLLIDLKPRDNVKKLD